PLSPHALVSCVYFLMIPPPPRSTLFPYTTLFRSKRSASWTWMAATSGYSAGMAASFSPVNGQVMTQAALLRNVSVPRRDFAGKKDRKSTRLNSSHVEISYAVFCLKKKKKKESNNK